MNWLKLGLKVLRDISLAPDSPKPKGGPGVPEDANLSTGTDKFNDIFVSVRPKVIKLTSPVMVRVRQI